MEVLKLNQTLPSFPSSPSFLSSIFLPSFFLSLFHLLLLSQTFPFNKNKKRSNLHFQLGFPGGSGGRESTCQCSRLKRSGFDLWVGKILWNRKWHPTPVSLPGKFHGQRSLVGYSPWGPKKVRHN